jgi:site-specific DNA-cytosine methylase/DNA-binding transcriptional MerR regulator
MHIELFEGRTNGVSNVTVGTYELKNEYVEIPFDVNYLNVRKENAKIEVLPSIKVDTIDMINRGIYNLEFTSAVTGHNMRIRTSNQDESAFSGNIKLNINGENNIIEHDGYRGTHKESFKINSPNPVLLTQSITQGRYKSVKLFSAVQFGEFQIHGDIDLSTDNDTPDKLSFKLDMVDGGVPQQLTQDEFNIVMALRQSIIAVNPDINWKDGLLFDNFQTNLHEYDLSNVNIADMTPGMVRVALTADIELRDKYKPGTKTYEIYETGNMRKNGTKVLNGLENVNDPSANLPKDFEIESDVIDFPFRNPMEPITIDSPTTRVLDEGDEAAYQEIDDADATPSKTPKKVSAGYKLQGSFRVSVPTSQLRRYREEVNKLAIQYGVDSDAYKKAMKKLDNQYRELINQASTQVLAIVNKIATEQRPNVTGYQQKDTTAARIGYAIKSIDRNFNNLPKPSGDAPDNRLGTYKMMFNALGEDYSVDAFRVSNRAQLKTVLQKQYKYDATNAGRVAEVVDRFARAWAFDKMQSMGFRPTQIVEVTGKLAENILETGAYNTPSSEMLFQHFPGSTAKETKIVAQYMREFYEERFAAFGVLDDAYDFTKKFRGAIFRTNKSKDDAVFNVIVGFASRDETTGIHEIAHALFRGMGYPFQKAIAEAMGVNSMTLKAMAKDGKFPIWVEEKWAAAFEGSLRAGVAPQARDATDAARQRQQDPTLSQLWMELGEFLTGARNATIKKKIASGEAPQWGLNEKGTEWIARFKPTDKLYSGNELQLTDGNLVSVVATQTAAGEPVQVVDIETGKVSTVSVEEIKRYAGRVPSGFNKGTLDTLSNWLRSYYGNTERNIRTTLPDMVADYVGGEVDLGQLRAEATNLQKVAFQEAMDEPRSPLLSSLSKISSVQAGIKSLLANNRLEIGNKGTIKNAYDRYGKPSNSFRLLRDVYGFDGNTAAAYYAQTETPEFKKWSDNLPLLEAVNSIQVSPDIDMNKMSPEERVNYRRYEAGNELANLASDIMRDGADDNDVDKFVDLADQYYRNDGRTQKEIRNAVEQIVNANEDDNVQQLMSFESTLRRELETSEDFDQARKVSVTPDEYRNAAHTPRTGKGFVTVSFPAMESSNLIRSKNGVVLTSGVTSFDGNRHGGEYIKFKNPQVVNLEGQGIDQQKLDRIIANATKAKRDGVVILNLRHSNTVNSALHNVAVPITKYPTKSIVAVPGVDIGTYFSGGGTLEASVYESVFPTVAVEYNAEIASVYRANLGDHVQVKDVQEIDPTSLKDVQWFHASPVCKNFSDANPNAIETILDKKTGKAVVDAIDHSHPPIVTIENVAKYRESESFDAILEALRRNGYEFDYGVYKTSKYGGGTSRQRLIVRAVRGFALPPIIKTDASQRTWYESIKDIIDTLPISELAPNQLRKLEASKIDVRAMKTPVLFSQNSYHAVGITADKVFPSFTTSGGTYRILMPGGTVRAITGVAFRRMMGLPDAYLLPESEPLSRKILANGVPAELSQTIMAPLADAYARHNMTRMAQREMRRRDTDDEAAYHEMDEVSKTYSSFDQFVAGVNAALSSNNLPPVTERNIRFYISSNKVRNGVKSGRSMTYTDANVNDVINVVKDKLEAEARENVRKEYGVDSYPKDLHEQATFKSIDEFTVGVNQFLELAGAEPITERLIRYYVSEGLVAAPAERQGRAKIWTQDQLEKVAELAVQSQMRKSTRTTYTYKPRQATVAAPMPYERVADIANNKLKELGYEPVTIRTIRWWVSEGMISKPTMVGRDATFDESVIDEIIKLRQPKKIEKLTSEEVVIRANEKLSKLGLSLASERALRYWVTSGLVPKPEKISRTVYFGDDAIDAIVKIRQGQSRLDTGDDAAYQEADDLFPSQRRTVETSDMPGAPMYVERIRPKQLPPRNAWFWGAIDLYNDITRLPLSGDLAFQNLQGGIIGLSNPLVGLKAFKAGLKGFAPNMQVEVGGKLYGSRKFGRETYHAAGDEMRRHPMYNLAKEADLPLAMFEIDARLQEAREIALSNLKMTNPNATMKDVKIGLMDIDELGTVDEWYSKNRITRHLPMQGQFERYNSLVHDTLLLTQFDNWVKILLSKGYKPNTTMFNNALKDAARILAVSIGDIKYSTNPENDAAASRIAKIFFTAPRWLMSRALIDPFINQMVSNSSIFSRLREIMGEDNPAFNLYNGDKEVAKLGQSMWLRIAGAEAMLAIMAWVFSNWYPDTEVNTDIQPGRIRIGDFQLDPAAGLIDHYKLAGRLAKAVFSVDPKDASRAEKEGIPQWMMAVKDISKELSYKASPGITFLQAISGSNDLKAQSDNFFTAPWEAKALNVVGEPLFERSASAKIFYDMIRPRLRELFGDAVADDLPISNMMMDRIPMALPGFVESFASAKEYDRDPWVYAMADTIPNFFGFKVDVMPTEARKDRAKDKNMSTAQESPTLLRLLAEGRASEAFTGTMKASPPSGNVNPW